VTDDRSECLPLTEADLELFEARLGNLIVEIFGQWLLRSRLRCARVLAGRSLARGALGDQGALRQEAAKGR